MAASQRSMTRAENRLVLHEFAAHAPPLRTLAAHHERDARSVLRARGERGARQLRILLERKFFQLRHGVRHRAGDEREPVRVMVPARAERVGQIGQQRRGAVEMLALGQPGGELPGAVAQRLLGTRGKDDRPRALGIFAAVTAGMGARRLGEDGVGIGAAEAERVHAGKTLAAVGRFREAAPAPSGRAASARRNRCAGSAS